MWILPNNQIISVPQNVVINDIQHPQTIFNFWSKEDLARVGVRRFHSANPQPGFRVIASRTEIIDDEVYEVVDVVPVELPPPPPVEPVEVPVEEPTQESVEEPSTTTP
jgi:hypothetical protein